MVDSPTLNIVHDVPLDDRRVGRMYPKRARSRLVPRRSVKLSLIITAGTEPGTGFCVLLARTALYQRAPRGVAHVKTRSIKTKPPVAVRCATKIRRSTKRACASRPSA